MLHDEIISSEGHSSPSPFGNPMINLVCYNGNRGGKNLMIQALTTLMQVMDIFDSVSSIPIQIFLDLITATLKTKSLEQ